MKKILAFILCAILICATPIIASAEGEPVEEDVTVSETLPSENETEAEDEKTITEIIVGYVKDNIEEISVIGALIVSAFYNKLKNGKLDLSIGTLNNNAIAVAENSAAAIKSALEEVEGIAEVVRNYKDEFAEILSEIRKSAEEKKSIEETLAHVETFLKTSKCATLELSNEVAELLVLANIPNSKKEELYSRHRAAVDAIAVAETTEVKDDDGKTA